MRGDEEEVLIRDDSGLLHGGEAVEGVGRPQKWCTKLTKTLCLSSAFFVLGLLIAIPGPTLLDLGSMLNASTSEMMLVFVSRSAGYLLGGMLGGILFDCFDKQLLLFCTLLVSSIATIVIPWTVTLVVMATMFGLQGITMGVLDTGGNIFCIRIWGRKTGPYMQTLHFAYGIGAFVAPLLARPFLSTDMLAPSTTALLQGNVPVPQHLPENLLINRSMRSTGLHVVTQYDALPAMDSFDVFSHDKYLMRQKREDLDSVMNKSESSTVLPTSVITMLDNLSGNTSVSEGGGTSNDTLTNEGEDKINGIMLNTSVNIPGNNNSDIVGANTNTSDTGKGSTAVLPIENEDNDDLQQEEEEEEVVQKPSKPAAATDKQLDKNFADGSMIKEATKENQANSDTGSQTPVDETHADSDSAGKQGTPEDKMTAGVTPVSTQESTSDKLDEEQTNGNNSSNSSASTATTTTGTPETVSNVSEPGNDTIALSTKPVTASSKIPLAVTSEASTQAPATTTASKPASSSSSSTTTTTTAAAPTAPPAVIVTQTTTEASTTTKITAAPTTMPKPTTPTTIKPVPTTIVPTTTTTTTIAPSTTKEQPESTKQPTTTLGTTPRVDPHGDANLPESEITPDNDQGAASEQTTTVVSITSPAGNVSEASDATITPKSTSTKPTTTWDKWLNKISSTVKNISRIQIAYLIVGLALLMNALMFLVLYCRDKGSMSHLSELDMYDYSRNEGFCYKFVLVCLLGTFFFCYVGMEVTYGALVTTFAVDFNRWPKTQGATVAAIFWGSLAVGRGVSVFIARCCGATLMLVIDLVLMCVGGLVLSIGIYFYQKLLWLGTLILGLGMSSAFPAGITWAESYFRLTGKSTAVLVVGSALGQMVVPVMTGYLFDRQDGMVLMHVTLALSIVSFVIFISMHCFATKMASRPVRHDRNGFLPLEDEEDNDDDENVELDLLNTGYTQKRWRKDNRGGTAEYRTLVSDLEDD